MIFLAAVVWEGGQTVSWKYSLLSHYCTILTSQLGEVRSLQHIASTWDAFQLYHLEPCWKPFIGSPLAIMIIPRWPAPTIDSGAKWLPVNPTFTSLAKNSRTSCWNQIRTPSGVFMSNSYMENISISIRAIHFLGDPFFLGGYKYFQPGKW